jgi:hypothetical protein
LTQDKTPLINKEETLRWNAELGIPPTAMIRSVMGDIDIHTRRQNISNR